MEKDYSYSSQVNRRLSAARFLIAAQETHQAKSSTAAEKQAYIDSILLQLYFACASYCNELLSHHQKPALNNSALNLSAVFDETEKTFLEISQFNELRTLYDQKSSGLSELCLLFDSLGAIGSKEEQEKNRLQSEQLQKIPSDDASQNSLAEKISLLDVDTVRADLSEIKTIKKLLQELQDLIDRQREYLLEY